MFEGSVHVRDGFQRKIVLIRRWVVGVSTIQFFGALNYAKPLSSEVYSNTVIFIGYKSLHRNIFNFVNNILAYLKVSCYIIQWGVDECRFSS